LRNLNLRISFLYQYQIKKICDCIKVLTLKLFVPNCHFYLRKFYLLITSKNFIFFRKCKRIACFYCFDFKMTPQRPLKFKILNFIRGPTLKPFVPFCQFFEQKFHVLVKLRIMRGVQCRQNFRRYP